MTILPADDGPLRPSRSGYAVAAVVAVVGLAAGVALWFVPGRFGGDLGQRMTPGQPTTVHLETWEPGGGAMVWARTDDPGSVRLACSGVAVDGQQPEEWSNAVADEDGTVLVAAGQRWRPVHRINARPPGGYAITCTGPAGTATPELSIGTPPLLYGPKARALSTLGALLLGFLGLLTGGVVAAVVAARRHGHRNRLSPLP